MNLKLRLRSAILNLVVSERVLNANRRFAEVRRKLMGRRHVVSVFLELDDPYSYLLCHYLPEFAAHYDVELRFYLTEAITGAFRPAPELYSEYAINDCRQLARELGIPFLDKGTPPVEHRVALLDSLATAADRDDFQNELLDAIGAYWRGDLRAVTRIAEGARSAGIAAGLLEKNQRRLAKLGHYNAATINYAGEWYWGVDRLHYLCERLDSLGAQRGKHSPAGIASISQVMHVNLPVKPPAAANDLPPLEFFHSFRSPYSYLALRRFMDIADAYGLEFQIRPVLPMVMRGMQVPRTKLLYIATDTSRESRRLNVPFGKIADPVGLGVERCLAVLQYAVGENRERDFLLNAGEAIWNEAVDVATDEGLRKVTAKSGLFWPEAKASIEKDEWRQIADDNRQSMMESGSWGVPTVRIGEFVTWGQDRDWLLVRKIEELCDTGDGIIV
jgi:2-hydroxychromene-2-carboxylate isomerase